MKYSLGISSLLCLFLIACSTKSSKTPSEMAAFDYLNNPSTTASDESASSANNTAATSSPTKNESNKVAKSDSVKRSAAEELEVKLKDNSTGKELTPAEKAQSKEKRQEISQAINETESDIQKIVSKDVVAAKSKNPVVVKTENAPAETKSAADMAKVSNEIDSAITEMNEKVEGKIATDNSGEDSVQPPLYPFLAGQSESTTVKTPAIDKTEEARLRAEAVLSGKQVKSESTNLGERKVGAVPAEKALGWLKNGNKRFVSGKLRADGQSAKDRLRTAQGQAPHAAVITCSDSRMIPELIFDQKLGEIYSVRVVDLSVALNVQASLDFAINSLGTNLVVLLGSETCGNEQKIEFLYNQLLEKSAILRNAAMNDQVRVVRGFYDLKSGTVNFK